MKGFKKAFKLELNKLKEHKSSLFLYIILPGIINFILYFSSSDKTTPYGTYGLYGPILLPFTLIFITTQLTALRIVSERSPYGTLDRELTTISRSGMIIGKFLAARSKASTGSFGSANRYLLACLI